MTADPHPGFRLAANLLDLVNEGVHAVLIGSGETFSRALATSRSGRPVLRVVSGPADEQHRRTPRRRPASL